MYDYRITVEIWYTTDPANKYPVTLQILQIYIQLKHIG